MSRSVVKIFEEFSDMDLSILTYALERFYYDAQEGEYLQKFVKRVEQLTLITRTLHTSKGLDSTSYVKE